MKALAMMAAVVAVAMASTAAAQGPSLKLDEETKAKAVACFKASFAARTGLEPELAGELAAYVVWGQAQFLPFLLDIAGMIGKLEPETCPADFGRVAADSWVRVTAKQQIRRWRELHPEAAAAATGTAPLP